MEWIASRKLRDADTGAELNIAIGRPRQVADEEWACAFRIDGELQADAHGVDAFQALLMAVEGLHHTLARSTQRLTWLGDPGDAGVPRFTPISFGLAFRQRIEGIIDDEIVDFSAQAQRRGRRRADDAP